MENKKLLSVKIKLKEEVKILTAYGISLVEYKENNIPFLDYHGIKFYDELNNPFYVNGENWNGTSYKEYNLFEDIVLGILRGDKKIEDVLFLNEELQKYCYYFNSIATIINGRNTFKKIPNSINLFSKILTLRFATENFLFYDDNIDEIMVVLVDTGEIITNIAAFAIDLIESEIEKIKKKETILKYGDYSTYKE